MNLAMIRVMKGYVDDGISNDYLVSQLDLSKEVALSHTIQEDEEDEISNKDPQNDADEIALNETEIINIYVSLKTRKGYTYFRLFSL